jgi:hypothetical protein
VTALTIPRNAPVKTGAGKTGAAKGTTVAVSTGKNGARTRPATAGANGATPVSDDQEPPVRSQSATARSLARPNRPNRRRRRR